MPPLDNFLGEKFSGQERFNLIFPYQIAVRCPQKRNISPEKMITGPQSRGPGQFAPPPLGGPVNTIGYSLVCQSVKC
jgi:hypothetical protein